MPAAKKLTISDFIKAQEQLEPTQKLEMAPYLDEAKQSEDQVIKRKNEANKIDLDRKGKKSKKDLYKKGKKIEEKSKAAYDTIKNTGNLADDVIGDVGDEVKFIKNPLIKSARQQALSRLLGLAAGTAGVLSQEELGPEEGSLDYITENPNESLENRMKALETMQNQFGPKETLPENINRSPSEVSPEETEARMRALIRLRGNQ